MAMILDAFVGRCIDRLAEFIEGEMSMMLGVKNELKKLQRKMERISGFLQSAEQRRHEDPNINTWVRELKDILYDADDIIDLCMIEGSKLLEDHMSKSAVRHPLPLFSCFGCIMSRHEIGSKIRELNDRLKEIKDDRSRLPTLEYAKKDAQVRGVNLRQTFPVEIKSDIVGTQIEDATQRLVESLIMEDNKKYRILGIVGMGGIGKTTLGRNIFNDERIKENFPIRVWVCISQEFVETNLLKQMIRDVVENSREAETKARNVVGNCGEAETKAELIPYLSSVLSKRFFIVLDDVWGTDVWEHLLRYPIESATASGRILITTRNTNVARNMRAQIHHVNKMDDDSGWTLLQKNVFGDDDEEEEISILKEIGIKIVEKCDGLPLAIKTIAGVLRSMDRSTIEWNKVLKSDAWSMSQLHEELPGALFLSYESLRSDLKQCFLYCSLYPEDSTMFKEDLIHYWVAEGFVKPTQEDILMEDLAEDCYKELIGRNLLHGSDYDNRCSMHDLLRSLALFLTKDESTFAGDGQSPRINPLAKVRRLSMVNVGERVEIPDAIKQQKCLRTLNIFGGREAKIFENDFFGSLRLLRVISINDTKLESHPDSVGDLLHLRYLDLDRTNIKELPESIGRLVNLQTLSLSGCELLHSLPKAVTKLCNLRCLRLEGTPLTHVPKGIGKLKHLNHLQGFVVGHDDRRDTQDDEGCSLEELQSLSQLRFLWIRRLERAQPGEALVLANSHSLRTLILEDRRPEDEEETSAIQRINRIYNKLRPQSTHLQKFEINNFIGTGFPDWMMSSSLGASFPNLTSIKLDNCISCPQLPPLGRLPQLKYLYISKGHAIKTIGPEFLGPRSNSFPMLEDLCFEWMWNWKEWSFGMAEGDGEERIGAPKLLLHRLSKLTLDRCPKLRALPPLGMLPELKYLRIEKAEAIKSIGPEFLGPRSTSFPKLEELIFAYMENWEEWSFGMVEGDGEERGGAPKLLPRLRKLTLDTCPKLRAPPPLGMLPELKSLDIFSCAIKTIGPEFLGPRASSAATSFPKLEELTFRYMQNWEEWSFGMVVWVGEERRGAPKLLPQLRKLELLYCRKLRALPEGLQHATNLQRLIITDARDLIEINNLPSLKSLEIDRCPRLEHVENLDKLQFLKFTDVDGQTQRLPRWLVELLQNAPAALPSLKEFGLICSLSFLKTFLKDRPNWPIIQPVPQVSIQEHGRPGRSSSYVQYTKEPPTFETNVVESK